MPSNGKVAIITGAGSGIGRSSVLHLLKDGYSVVLAGRRREPLDETIKLSGADDSRTLAVPTDVSDPDSIAELFAITGKRFERVDVLFNNAGVGAPRMHMEDLPLRTGRELSTRTLQGALFVRSTP